MNITDISKTCTIYWFYRKSFIPHLTTRERHQLTGTSSVTVCRVLVRVNNVQPTRVVNMSQNK